MVEIVLNGPGKNALGTPVMTQALADLAAAKGQPVLLRGHGDVFSAGLNLKEIATLDADGMGAYLALFDRLLVALLTHDAPLVACIEGHAIAGGCVLALACDLRVASARAELRIGLNEVPLGLVFPPRVIALARARLAPSHLARVILEGGLYDPAESLRLGLVHAVHEDALAAGRAQLARLAASPRAAYVAAKRELNRGAVSLSAEEEASFVTHVLPTWTGPELRTMVQAALSKRGSA